jgi:hypothetical protein
MELNTRINIKIKRFGIKVYFIILINNYSLKELYEKKLFHFEIFLRYQMK